MPAKRKGPTPVYPRNVPYPSFMVRVSREFGIMLAELDEYPIEAIMDELEINAHLYDVDNPPT